MSTVMTVIEERKRPTAPLIVTALVRSSVWVSAALSSMLYFAGHMFGVDIPPSIYLLGFVSSMFVMNFDHLADARFEAANGSKAADRWVITHWALAAGGAAVLLYAMTLVATPVRIVCACYGLIGVAYGFPFFPLLWSRPVVWRRLKDIRGIKAWLVSAAIGFALIGLPLASAGGVRDWRTVVLTAAASYLFIVSNAHMFDIRDLRYDIQVGNSTLPTLIGAARTKRWLIRANVVGLIVIAAAQAARVVPFHPELDLGVLLTLAYLRLLPEDSSEVRYALVIDGCIFIMPLAARLHEILGGAIR